MNKDDYNNLITKAISGEILSPEICKDILVSENIEVLPLLNAAYEVRKKYCGKEVLIHIINNAQNGYCPEDCHYCAQGKDSTADIEEYPVKSDEEFLSEAKAAYEKGAHRYCMVFAGRGPSKGRTEKLAGLIQKIKSQYPLEICVSAGLVDDEKAKVLKEAGLNRLNHNLNSSRNHYPKICTTHTFEDRLNTLKSAQKNGLEVCSGIIVGMGESIEDVIEVALTLRDMNVKSIPVNFFIPIEGTLIKDHPDLTPEYCLRVLCLFRFLNPKAEIRIAAGREIHLRDMEAMSLYAANSLFLDGYLNTLGAKTIKTLQMIKDAGFTIKSDHAIEEILAKAPKESNYSAQDQVSKTMMKELKDLRPNMPCSSK